MPGFLAPLLAGAARVAGPAIMRSAGPALTRGAGTTSGLRGLSAAQFSASAMNAFSGGNQQNDKKNQPTPFGGASG
jgi:hypothetical protein